MPTPEELAAAKKAVKGVKTATATETAAEETAAAPAPVLTYSEIVLKYAASSDLEAYKADRKASMAAHTDADGLIAVLGMESAIVTRHYTAKAVEAAEGFLSEIDTPAWPMGVDAIQVRFVKDGEGVKWQDVLVLATAPGGQKVNAVTHSSLPQTNQTPTNVREISSGGNGSGKAKADYEALCSGVSYKELAVRGGKGVSTVMAGAKAYGLSHGLPAWPSFTGNWSK